MGGMSSGYGTRGLGNDGGPRPNVVKPGVSVVIPTIGRPEQLRACLGSIEDCEPAPDEVVVVDQGEGDSVKRVVEGRPGGIVRHVRSRSRGRGFACNEGLRSARNEIVLFTDDDCVVARDWVGVAIDRMERWPAAVITGRVLPTGDPGATPSLQAATRYRDYTGILTTGVLWAGNMACSRRAVLALGGFDPRVYPSAEDNEFCYRWLSAGGALHFVPELVVWHNDWRTREELERLYVTYATGEGVWYAKYLRRGDLHVLRFLMRTAAAGLRGTIATLLRGGHRSADWRLGVLRGLPAGLLAGWRRFR
jgi:GT2 family glycosyltransferase